MATLTEEELKQAVKEWLQKRGIPVDDSPDIVIVTRHLRGPQTTTPSSDDPSYDFNVQIRGIQLKEGPYR
jgi:hypothetical protein